MVNIRVHKREHIIVNREISNIGKDMVKQVAIVAGIITLR
jgi:hypothetical protein